MKIDITTIITEDLSREVHDSYRADDKRVVPTGFSTLDQLIVGLRPGLTILTSRSENKNKRVFAIDIANHIEMNRSAPISYFTYDESNSRIAFKFLFQRVGIPFKEPNLLAPFGLTIQEKELQKLEVEIGQMYRTTFYIHSGSQLTLKGVREQIWNCHDEKSGLVVIDNIQSLVKAVTGLYDPPMKMYSSILSKLEKTSKEVGVPILILSDLPMCPREREYEEPSIEHLEKSGVLALYTNLIIFLEKTFATEEYGLYELIVAKNSYGRRGRGDARFDDETGRFVK